jgi:hypothetical protein
MQGAFLRLGLGRLSSNEMGGCAVRSGTSKDVQVGWVGLTAPKCLPQKKMCLSSGHPYENHLLCRYRKPDAYFRPLQRLPWNLALPLHTRQVGREPFACLQVGLRLQIYAGFSS